MQKIAQASHGYKQTARAMEEKWSGWRSWWIGKWMTEEELEKCEIKKANNVMPCMALRYQQTIR